MTRDEAIRQTFMQNTLVSLGVKSADVWTLRRISMQLHRWHELECGTDNGCVERDETTGKTYWVSSYSGRRSPCADRETGALKRLAKTMAQYPNLRSFVQGDPRGCALYVLRPADVPPGCNDDAYYPRGIAVY